MYWKEWLKNQAPNNWSLEDYVRIIKADCPNVTVEEIKRVLIAKKEIRNSKISKAIRNYY
jgi:2-phospho-L-lactate guanylyltransferase (CobY/MobA/RfbA family)